MQLRASVSQYEDLTTEYKTQVHVCVCVCVCVCLSIHVHMYIRTYVRTYICVDPFVCESACRYH